MHSSENLDLSPLQRRKRAAILAGAEDVFLTRGYGSATMDEVAAAAGVGKQTVYRHFASKEALFETLVASMCARGALMDEGARETHCNVEGQLRRLGEVLVRNLTAVNSLRLYRAVIADAERRPDLGRLFYDNGPRLVRGLAAQILRTVYPEPTASARAATFVSLVLGDAHLELTLGYHLREADRRFAEQIEEAVHAALRD